MFYSNLKKLIKKFPPLWKFLTWHKDRLIFLSRMKDVLMMMILFHVWPEQTYRFSTRNALPSKKNRFSKESKQVIPYDLLKSKSSNIPIMEEINVVGIGSSFDLNNLKDLKGPIFRPCWAPLRIDNNGKIFYKHVHLHYENYEEDKDRWFFWSVEENRAVGIKELFNNQINKNLIDVTYLNSRRIGIELFKKNNNSVLALNVYGTDKDGHHYPYSKEWETSSYRSLFDHDQCRLIAIADKIYKPPLGDHHHCWAPAKSFLPALCALSFFAKKINVYGWDFYLDSSPENMSYWQLFFQMYKYNLDIGLGFFEVDKPKYLRMTKEHFESSLINLYYGYQLSKLPKFKIHGYMGQLGKHHKLIQRIERVLFN